MNVDEKQWDFFDFGSRIIDLNQLNLIDDVALSVALEDNPQLAKAILAPILSRRDFEVESVRTQVRSGMVRGHFVVFDCVIVFADGTKVDLEMQKARKDMPLERMIYNRAMLRVGYSLGPGERYQRMRPTIVVVILNGDFFGKGWALYRLSTVLMADPCVDLEPGQGIYIVNSNNKDASTELGRLMSDISATDPAKINNSTISGTLEMLKSSRGVNLMSQYWQDYKESVFKEMHDALTKELTEKLTKEITEKLTKKITKDLTRKISADLTKEIIEDRTREITEKVRAEQIVSLYLEGAIDADVAKKKLGLSSEEEFQNAIQSLREDA